MIKFDCDISEHHWKIRINIHISELNTYIYNTYIYK